MQTTYQRDFTVATPGLLTDLQDHTAVTRSACGILIFGHGVSEAETGPTNWHQSVRLPRAADEPRDFRGIALRIHTLEQNPSGSAYYPHGHAATILTRGVVWGIAGSHVEKGAGVYIALASNPDELEWQPGRFVRDAGPELSMPLCEVARAAYLTNANPGELVKISIDYASQPFVAAKKGGKK